MDPPLRQIRLRSDRRARPSARTHLPAPSLAQRIVLCRHPLDRQVPLHLSLLAYICAQGLDPCRTCLSSVQSDLFMVCTRELLRRFRRSFPVFRAEKEPADEGKSGCSTYCRTQWRTRASTSLEFILSTLSSIISTSACLSCVTSLPSVIDHRAPCGDIHLRS